MTRIALLVAFLIACGSKSEDKGAGSAGSGSAGSGSSMAAGSGSGSGSAMAAADAAVDAAAPIDAAEAPAFDFNKLTHDEKVAFMKKNVLPAMKTAFQKFDAKKYKGFNCKTCHGKNADKNKFKMPTADLPKLDFAKLKAGKQAPKVAEFMGKVVKPDMAKILQMEEYDDAHPKGFGCLECHMAKK